MGLFHKNTNEMNFSGGSKNVVESIQNDFQGTQILVKRDTREDFNNGSTLTVQRGEEAVFIKNGEIMGVIGSGAHVLHTENYPFLSRLRNMLSGGASTYTCRIYYVRTAHTKIEWGTANPLQYHDKWFQCPTIARGNGEYWIKFRDIPLFIDKLMGNEYGYTVEQLREVFNGYINSLINSELAKCLGNLTADRAILAIDNEMCDLIVEMVTPKIQELLDEYGLELVRYYIQAIYIEEDERRAEAVTIGTQALSNARALETTALGKLAERERLGDQYNRIKGMDLLQKLAENPGAGGVASAGAGIGMGMAAAGAFSGLAQSVFSDATEQRSAPRASFGNAGRFESKPSEVPDPVESLQKMKQLLDAALISQAQYDAKVSEILNRM